MCAEFRVGKTGLYGIDKVGLEYLSCSPYLLIAHLINAVEAILVIMMCLELLAEYTGVNCLPLLCSPGRIVHTVGNVAHIEFLRQITRIHRSEDILAHLAVKHRYAIDILTHIGCEHGHRELLVAVIRMIFAEAHKASPVKAVTLRIAAEVASHSLLIKGIVSGRDRCMGGEKG